MNTLGLGRQVNTLGLGLPYPDAVPATVGVKHYAKKKYEDDLDNFLLPWEIKDKNKTVVVEKQKTGKFAKKQFIVHNTLESEYITELKAEQKRKRRKKAIAMLLESL